MTNSQKNKLFSVGTLFAVFLPMFLHLIHNAINAVYGPDLFYTVIYAPVVLWLIWSIPQGGFNFELFPEVDDMTKE